MRRAAPPLLLAAAVGLCAVAACGEEADTGAVAVVGAGGAGGEQLVGGQPAAGGDGGQGGEPLCTPGAEEACYDGPATTLDVASCRGGMRTCADDGHAWGPCEGQVLPGVEDCAAPADEDCDGVTDEENATGCSNYLYDADGDGTADQQLSKCLCAPAPPYTVLQ